MMSDDRSRSLPADLRQQCRWNPCIQPPPDPKSLPLPICKNCGSGTCAVRAPFFSTLPFLYAELLLRYLRVRKEHQSLPTRPSTIHTRMVPVRVRKEHLSFPPSPSTIHYIGSGTCAKRTPFFSTRPSTSQYYAANTIKITPRVTK